MSKEPVCILDLSIPEAVRNAFTPDERLQHDIAVQLAGRNAVGGICSLPSPTEVSLFAERHPDAYQQLADQVTSALVAGGIMSLRPELSLVPGEPLLQGTPERIVNTEVAA